MGEDIAASGQPPLVEFHTPLLWTLEIDPQYFYCDPSDPTRATAVGLKFMPDFPGIDPELRHKGIVGDLLALRASACRPGGHWLFNCECGHPPHAGIEAPVFVSHPDANTVIWEIDAAGLAPLLAPEWRNRDGFLRLVFQQAVYIEAIREMVRLAQSGGGAALPVEEMLPNIQGGAYERVLALDARSAIDIQSIFPPGTLLEFGFIGRDLCRVNGQPDRGWPTRYFSCWEVDAAFKRWLSFARRGFALDNIPQAWRSANPGNLNDFFMIDPATRSQCDEAGEDFVACLRAAFAEGETAPGVEVRYLPCGDGVIWRGD